MTDTKFKGSLQPRDQKYQYISIAFFGDDKKDMIEVLNEAQLPYASLNHFVRTAINTQLRTHGIEFHITER